MKKSFYIKSLALQKLLNLSEYLLIPLVHEPLPNGVVLEKNIAYGDPKENELCNFIYQKNSVEEKIKQPLMIMIHGGGWVSGLKDLRNYYSYHAAEEGYFVASEDVAFGALKVKEIIEIKPGWGVEITSQGY